MSQVNPLSNFMNTSAMIQRNLRLNQLTINQTLERLSTGLRINRASDDPVGITVAGRTNTQLIGNRQAASNTQQSISLADTAADGIQSVMSNLNAIRALIVHSLSDSASPADRKAIQYNIDKLVADTDRIARLQTFNTRELLDGSLADTILPASAYAEIQTNVTLKDTSGASFQFLTSAPTIDPTSSQFDLVQFRVIDNGSGGYGLEVSTANSGVVATYNDISTAPTTVSVGGNNYSIADIVGSSGTSGPLTAAELDQDLASLVASGRINAVTYGDLDLTLGGTAFNNVYDVQGSSTINNIISAINGATTGISASYNSGTGRITIQYDGTKDATTTRVSGYSTAATPVDGGGPFTGFSSLSAPQGPAYRNVDPFLPTGPFDPDSLPSGTVFAASGDIPLNTALDYTGSSAALLSFFGLSNTTNNYQITDYDTEYYGDLLDLGGGNYANRTRVVITSATGEQLQTGTQDTGLTAGDLTKSLGELGTPAVTLTSGATSIPSSLSGGPFTINFGTNGTFSYNFDPAVDTIQSVINAINAYGTSLTNGGTVGATFDATTGRVTISNDPPDSVSGAGIVEDTELTNSQLKIRFGSKSSDIVTINNPTDLTIDEVVQSINDQLSKTAGTTVNVASFSYASLDDRLTFDLSKYVDSKGTQLGFGTYIEIDVSGSPGPDGESNAYDVADFFNLIPEAETGSNFDGVLTGRINATGSIVNSYGDIDNSADLSGTDPREITTSIYLNSTLAELVAPITVSGDNSITFGTNATSAGIQDFLNIPNVANTGTGAAQTTVSTADIDNGATYSGLNITNPGSRTFTELLTAQIPPAGSLIGTNLTIDGTNLINISSSTTLQNILDAINGYNNGAAPSHKDYQASFASGRISINTIDTESLSNPGSQAAANPGGAAPTVNRNTITLDTASYNFSGNPAPTNFGPSATPPGSGDTPYLYTTPTAPGDISSISFGGATNIASVLSLANVGSASVSGPTTLADVYTGTFASTGANTYDLTGTQTRTFGARSATTSTASIGNSTASGGGIDPSSLPTDGVVARINIVPAIQGSFIDKGIVFQIGGNEGNTMRFNVGDLTADALDIEGLKTYQVGDSDILARLRGENALRIVDHALEEAQEALAQVGVFGRILENNLDLLETNKVSLSQSLSDWQDANLDEEIATLTKAQITAQTGAAIQAQNMAHTQALYSVLFGGGGGLF